MTTPARTPALTPPSAATLDSRTGRAVLTLAHVAGMIDMVALPLWVGTLMQHHGYSAPQAGATVTAFLLAVAAASFGLAPRLNRLPRWAGASLGFQLATLAFGLACFAPVSPRGFGPMLALHGLAGLGVGWALSVTHGRIGRSANPHRLFALINVMLGVFAIVFLAGMPPLIARFGPATLFVVFASVMGLAAAVTAAAFPHTVGAERAARAPSKLPRAAWFVVAAVVCLTLNQAMVFSFVERIGAERGFGIDRVHGVLIALGFVNLLPGVLAALLQKRLPANAVGVAGQIAQATLALVLTGSLTFGPYAVASALYVSMVIFTHTFLFGLLARLDGSGRATAMTPAMMMLGSAAGPAVGGGVVQALGYAGLGYVACGVAAVGACCMLGLTLSQRPAGPALAEVAR